MILPTALNNANLSGGVSGNQVVLLSEIEDLNITTELDSLAYLVAEIDETLLEPSLWP